MTLYVAFATVVLILQLTTGAYRIERGAHSDEAAHFLNGLLLRDYLTEGLGQNPRQYAEQYYLSYPKIAPGAWPPLFHLVLGTFLLPGWPPHAAALVLMALVTAYAVWRLFTLVRHLAPAPLAATVAGLFLLTPAVQRLSTAVMVDPLVTALMLEAVVWFARYAVTGTRSHAVLFGLAAAACCLAKGSGLPIVLVPAFFVLFTSRYRLLAKPGLYVAALIVVLLAAPPLIASYPLAASNDDFGSAGALGRLLFYASFVVGQLGWLATILASVGFGAAIFRRADQDQSPPVAAVLAALATSLLAFHAFYRYAGERYGIALIAALLGLIPIGISIAADAVPRWSRAVRVSVSLATVATFLLAHPLTAPLRPLGFRAVAGFLDAREAIAGNRILVVSDEHGEGAFVAEVAVRHLAPRPTILRASKLLSTSDWIGDGYYLLFATRAQVTQELEDLHISYVLVDASEGDADPPHWRAARDQMIAAVASAPDRYERADSISPAGGYFKRDITVYRLRYQSPGPAKTLRIDLQNSIGKVLER